MRPNDLSPDLLPWSEEAERGVLGCLLLDNSAWDRVGDLLQDRHFYVHGNGLIFTAIATLILGSKPADIFTVLDRLQGDGTAEEVGGLGYLNGLAQGVTSPRNARSYAEIVVERALLRGMLEAADQIKELAVTAGLAVSERIDRAQAVLQALHTDQGRAMPTPVSASVLQLLDRVQDVGDGKTRPVYSTGIPGLDRMIGGGLKGGKQVILAARPSIGKSSLALQICVNLAEAGHPAALFSQEMAKEENVDRAVANLGRIDLDNVISGRLDSPETNRLSEAVERLGRLPLFLDDQPALTLADIRAKARMLKRQHGIRLIAIDYLQLCASSGAKASDNRHHQIEELSRGLKNLARQLDITILSLSQLNREVEKRASGRPILSDLKESGSIEEDADIVMLLSRADTKPDGFQIINCDLPKNRQGRVGSIALGFNGSYQRWHETSAQAVFRTPPRKHYTEDV